MFFVRLEPVVSTPAPIKGRIEKVIKQARTPRSYGLTKRQYPLNVHYFLAIEYLFGIIGHMEKEQIEELKKAFEKIIAEPPFNGTVTHRTRPVFIAKWKEYLKANDIRGVGYIDDLLKAMGKRGAY